VGEGWGRSGGVMLQRWAARIWGEDRPKAQQPLLWQGAEIELANGRRHRGAGLSKLSAVHGDRRFLRNRYSTALISFLPF